MSQMEPSLIEYLRERGDAFKAQAEEVRVFGYQVKDLSRDELLMVIGFMARGLEMDTWILSIPKLQEAIKGGGEGRMNAKRTGDSLIR